MRFRKLSHDILSVTVDKNKLLISLPPFSCEHKVDLHHLDVNIAITSTAIKVLNSGTSHEVSGQYDIFRPNIFVEVL